MTKVIQADLPMRYDADHKQKTRERVLTEAARALRSDGPHRLGVAEVMSRAGLTHGGFYAHFKSKDHLLVAATEAAFEDARTMFEAVTGGLEPRAALAAYIDAYLSMRHLAGRDRGCPLPALAGDLPRMGVEPRRSYAAGVRRLTLRLQGLLEDAGAADAPGTARSVVAELVGALSLARATPDEEDAARMLEASRAALHRRLGLAANGP